MDFCGAVTHDGFLWMWGDNTFGQLGVSKVKHAEKPVRVTSIPEPVVQVSVSNGEKNCHVAAVT